MIWNDRWLVKKLDAWIPNKPSLGSRGFVYTTSYFSRLAVEYRRCGVAIWSHPISPEFPSNL
jgi:hypothetical protein